MRFADQRRVVDITDMDEGDVMQEIADLLRSANDPPSLFAQSRRMALVETVDGELRYERDISTSMLRAWLVTQAQWQVTASVQGVPTPRPAVVSKSVLEAFMELGEWRNVPELRDVVSDPYMLQDGTIVSAYGYNPESKIFNARAHSLPVEDSPPASHVDRARELLLVDVLGDFEFLSQADKANAVAAMLTSVTRYMYDCPLPLHLVDSTNPGSGKGFLAEAIGAVWGGSRLVPMSASEDELKKSLLSLLVEPEKVIVFDNVEHELGGPALNALLTSTTYGDRVLGSSKQLMLPNNKLWVATGNNIRLGKDMGRRSVWIRQDPQSNPAVRNETKKWRHPDLIRWCNEHHDALVWACLTLARSWVVNGAKLSEASADNSKEWSYTVGGILENCGIEGFLEDRADRKVMDEESEEIVDFIDALARALPDPLTAFTAHDVGELLKSIQGFDIIEVLPAPVRKVHDKGSGVTKSLGRWFEKVKGRYAGPHGWRVVRISDDTDRVRTYRLELDGPAIEHLRATKNTTFSSMVQHM